MRKHITMVLAGRRRRFNDVMCREHPAARAFAVQPRREPRKAVLATSERRPS